MTKKIILSAAIFGAVFMFGQERQKLRQNKEKLKNQKWFRKRKKDNKLI